MERILKYVLLLVGILVGSVHLWLAVKAMFVFRNDEPVSMWIFILTGPLSTLLAVITAFFWPKVGGAWLIFASVLSFTAALANVGINEDFQEIVWYFTSYSAPMLVLGVASFLLGRSR